MSELIINDEKVEIQPGERLLDVARKNASHIGFVCDGHGLCQMCECLVLKGNEQLSPPNEAEHAWLTQWQLDQGHRLACQASLRGGGSVTILTRAEALRRQAMAIFNAPENTPWQQRADLLMKSLVTVNVEHIKRVPVNMYHAIFGVFSLRPTMESARKMYEDSLRILNRVLSGEMPAIPASEQPHPYFAPRKETPPSS